MSRKIHKEEEAVLREIVVWLSTLPNYMALRKNIN